MRKILSAAAMAFALGAGHVQAEEPSALIGIAVGDDSCGNWLQARRRANASTMNPIITGMTVSWVQGFLSAQNPGRGLALPSAAVIESVLDKECGADPTTPVHIVADKLMFQLAKRQGRPLGVLVPSKP